MRRRLHLAASLVGQPEVLLLDEPTPGIDPQSRLDLWGLIRDLIAGDTTVLLTTQYLDDADQLASRIAVIDRGKLIAQGTGDELKDKMGGSVIELHIAYEDSTQALNAMSAISDDVTFEESRRIIRLRVTRGYRPRLGCSLQLPILCTNTASEEPMDRYRTPTVSLAEAYHVAQRWLTFLGAVPEKITEPADGIIELRSAGMVTRIKFDRSAIAPAAILAMLKATDGEPVRRLLFSVTGFTDGAKSLGEGRGFGLFDIDAVGDVHPHTTYARSLVPSEPLKPAFLHTPSPDDKQDDEVPVNPFGPLDTERPDEWSDCPRCGVTQHHSVEICVSCGADMKARGRVVAPSGGVTPTQGMAVPEASMSQASATSVPRAPAGGPRLRCRTCGSHDIELRHGD
jgi:hypothetical protein